MKSLFAGVLLAAALPASAAVINWSWSGDGFDTNGDPSGTVTASGQIDYTAGPATITSVNSMTWNLTGTAGFNGSGTFSSVIISFDPNTLTMTLGSGFKGISTGLTIDDNGTGNPAVVGTVGSWYASNDSNGLDWYATDGDVTLTLTAVPEPEAIAMVAGLGLVAFGAARRKFARR